MEQTFSDYEIILTDDSPDHSVENVSRLFANLPIRYYKNNPSKGTPANWNAGIEKAEGEWIKIMHDDDWFASPQSLQWMVAATGSGSKFIFSRYANVDEENKVSHPSIPPGWLERIQRAPMTLLARNVIGPPSVTLVHHSLANRYDERLKWRVDIDYYIQLLKKGETFALVDQCAVHVGISASQVTNDCIDLPEVELPEGLLLLEKYGITPLRNLLVYDAWWRILRNVGIRTEQQLLQYTPGRRWPAAIKNMAGHQARIPSKALHFGPISKTCMLLSYLSNKKYLQDT